jgi:hypothetical protein
MYYTRIRFKPKKRIFQAQKLNNWKFFPAPYSPLQTHFDIVNYSYDWALYDDDPCLLPGVGCIAGNTAWRSSH